VRYFDGLCWSTIQVITEFDEPYINRICSRYNQSCVRNSRILKENMLCFDLRPLSAWFWFYILSLNYSDLVTTQTYLQPGPQIKLKTFTNCNTYFICDTTPKQGQFSPFLYVISLVILLYAQPYISLNNTRHGHHSWTRSPGAYCVSVQNRLACNKTV